MGAVRRHGSSERGAVRRGAARGGAVRGRAVSGRIVLTLGVITSIVICRCISCMERTKSLTLLLLHASSGRGHAAITESAPDPRRTWPTCALIPGTFCGSVPGPLNATKYSLPHDLGNCCRWSHATDFSRCSKDGIIQCAATIPGCCPTALLASQLAAVLSLPTIICKWDQGKGGGGICG
jgi:hypothetical protein